MPEEMKRSEFHELDGAWEPKNYVGPRVKIEGSRLTRLWQNSPVLTTAFSAEKQGDRVTLKFETSDLCYVNSEKPYATVKECFYEDGGLTFVDDFPITGESRDTLYRTQNSRYGNVTVVDGETLPLLQGKWVREESEEYIIFRGNEICCGYGKDLKNCGEFVTVRRNGERDKECFDVVNKDPSKNMLGYYVNVRYEHGVITAQIPVCDAPQIIISFKKA